MSVAVPYNEVGAVFDGWERFGACFALVARTCCCVACTETVVGCFGVCNRWRKH